jgi:hypothetical protein
MSALIIGATWARIGRVFAEPSALSQERPDIGWATEGIRLKVWSGKIGVADR